MYAGSSVAFNGSSTELISGSMGTSPGQSITGNYQLGSGTIERDTPVARKCSVDRFNSYIALSIAQCRKVSKTGDLSGLTFTAGVYCTEGSNSLFTAPSSVMTIDGLNNPNSLWIFQSGSTLTIGKLSTVKLMNRALEENVFWKVDTTAVLGQRSIFAGNLMAFDSIIVGQGAVMVGRMLAKKSIKFAGGSAVSLPLSATSRTPTMRPTKRGDSVSPTQAPTTAKVAMLSVAQVT